MSQQIRIEPGTPEAVRAEIERTRERISRTIDEIEIALLRKKERIRERMDVAARIRERPLEAAAVAAVVGLLLGFLTGGRGGRKEEAARAEQAARSGEARAALWERRARRLLTIARGQEEEMDGLAAEIEHLVAVRDGFVRGRYGFARDPEEDDEDFEASREQRTNRFARLHDLAAERLADSLPIGRRNPVRPRAGRD